MAYWHHNQLIDHRLAGLGNSAKILGQFLAGCIDEDNQWQISRTRMKTKTGMSLSSINKALKELEDAGVIVAHRHSRRQAAQFFWALNCPLGCDVKSHHDGNKGVVIYEAVTESLESDTTEWSEPHTTEWSELLTTNTPVNKPTNKPIKKDSDPSASGVTILIEQLIPLLEDQHPDWNHLDLGEALQVDPDGVKKQLNKRLKGATVIEPYIATILETNPWCLLPEGFEPSRPYLEDDTTPQPEAAETVETVTPPKRAKSPQPQPGVSSDNMAWLGETGGSSEYRLRCAQVATELGLTIPLGTDTASAGQALRQALDLQAAGEKPQTLTSEMWQGRAEVSAQVVITG